MLRHALALALACIALASIAQQTGSFEAERTVRIAATIQAVTQGDRHVTLQKADGSKVIVRAGPAAENLNEIRSGDKVVVVYREGLVAEVRPKGANLPATANTVRIEAVNPSEHTVTFTRSNGERRKMDVVRADAMRFVEKLKPGDAVEVTFQEPVAISIERDAG